MKLRSPANAEIEYAGTITGRTEKGKCGRVTVISIIDRNFRAQHEAKAEWAREVERMKLIRMPDPDDVIFDFRTMAERINARLKDEFGARFVRVRGAIKVKCHLVFGLVALTVDQILRVTKFRPALT